MAQTKGEYRVGISFNPSGDDLVGQIKRAAADLIDLIETIKFPDVDDDLDDDAWIRAIEHCSEIRRLKAMAQNDIENAAMLAVKAATKPALEQ